MALAFDPNLLNSEQRRAVEHPGGPILIFAGAGSGKTRVITARIARLIQEGVEPSRIIAVTFTNKAAREMRERIEGMVGTKAKPLWMGTFHSMSAKLLRIDGEAIGIERNFVIYDDSDQLTLIKDILRDLNLDEKAINPRSVLHGISQAKEKLMTPSMAEAEATGYFERTVAEVYMRYQKRLNRANALDFDDLIFCCVRLFNESTSVREKYQRRFLHVLVDEYQDVNFAQYSLAHAISEVHRNITIVGDDDQSIYRWRGADVQLMHRFSSDHPDATVITLSQNYRSTPNILAAAHDIVRHNRGRAAKQLWTNNPEGSPIVVQECGTDREEATWIVDLIESKVRRGRSYGDFAVLYRTNAQSRLLEEVFLTMKVPHVLVGALRFYERKEIKDMIAYLRIVANPADEVSIRRVINTPARGVGSTSIDKLADLGVRLGGSLWDGLFDQEAATILAKKSLSGVRKFTNLIEEARELIPEGKVTPILKLLYRQSGYFDELLNEHTEEAHSRMENVQELLNVTQEYDASAEQPSIQAFLEQAALASDIDQLNETGEAVTLMTLHSSKGLEFPVVFLVGMEEGIFPHSRSQGSDEELEEERRLCYVGMTRAMEELYLAHAVRRSTFGSPSFNRRSRFLDDLSTEGVEFLSNQPQTPLRSVRQERDGRYTVVEPASAPKPASWDPPFKIGNQVRHPRFGVGVVIACAPLQKGDAEVTVAFPGEVGVKKLVSSLAKLEAL